VKKTIYLLSFLFLISLSACGSSGGSSTPTATPTPTPATTPAYVGTWKFAESDGNTNTWIFTTNTATLSFSQAAGCNLTFTFTATGSNPWSLDGKLTSVSSACPNSAPPIGKVMDTAVITVSSDNKTITMSVLMAGGFGIHEDGPNGLIPGTRQ